MARTHALGIQPKTATELNCKTPQQLHDDVRNLITMQYDCLYHVRLENVPKKLKEGYVLKCRKEQEQQVAKAVELYALFEKGELRKQDYNRKIREIK